MLSFFVFVSRLSVNVRSLFFGYVKSVASGGKGGPAYENMDVEIMAFTQQYGLDAECMQQLQQQPPHVAPRLSRDRRPRKAGSRCDRWLFAAPGDARRAEPLLLLLEIRPAA